jgi:protein phosphatase slingshot
MFFYIVFKYYIYEWICFSLNECYFANKGAALVLGGSERGCADQTRSPARAHPQPDIQHHLQSMFYLLRPEETLKMVPK